MTVPASRITLLRADAPAPRGEYVLYWMIAARRVPFNFGLERAVELSRELDRPLVVLEALRVGYAWASERLHTFVLEGMRDNAQVFARHGVRYYPYVEPEPGAGSGLLVALAEHAAVVVTDDSPAFFLPRMRAGAAAKLKVRYEAVDGNGLLPLSFAEGRSFTSAYSFRRFLQKSLDRALGDLPALQPLARCTLPKLSFSLRAIERRYPAAQLDELEALVAALPIDHDVKRAPALRGGHTAGRERMRAFLSRGLAHYAEGRNHPDQPAAASGLSPWLHFGQLGVHEIFHGLCEIESWDGIPRGDSRKGTRHGFWGLSPNAESFLDELVTWRELALNAAATLPHYERFASLPSWAKKTLAAHADDPRPVQYSLTQLEQAKTDDPIWNAAQRELLREGRMHNYLRMLWGKKILEWSSTPQVALKRMITLNNKYALDGRDPNSYAGIFWVLGRYDRPWGPERPIFGNIRYMTSASTKRKLKLTDYLARFGA